MEAVTTEPLAEVVAGEPQDGNHGYTPKLRPLVQRDSCSNITTNDEYVRLRLSSGDRLELIILLSLPIILFQISC